MREIGLSHGGLLDALGQRTMTTEEWQRHIQGAFGLQPPPQSKLSRAQAYAAEVRARKPQMVVRRLEP